MPAYMLIQADITDPVKFRAYAEAAARLVSEFGGRYLVLGGERLLLEGEEAGKKIVISEWPDHDTALRFWNSPQYAAARVLRQGTGTFQVQLLAALPRP